MQHILLDAGRHFVNNAAGSQPIVRNRGRSLIAQRHDIEEEIRNGQVNAESQRNQAVGASSGVHSERWTAEF